VDRVKKALAGLSGVEQVEFTPGKDEFTVYYRAVNPLTDEFVSAVLKTVVAPTVRGALGRVGDLLDRDG